MPVAAVRYASPASIPADLPRYAALSYPTGSVVPGDVKRLECGLYLPSESVPADRRRVGVVQYLPGATIPADMRRIIPVRSGAVAYANAVLADSPVAYWRLGESSGTSAADASGNANTGTYAGGVTLAQAGALAAEPDGTSDTAASFDGASGMVSASDAALPSGNGDRTLEAWVYPTGAGGGAAAIVEYGTTFGTDFMAYMNGSRKVVISDTSGTGDITSTATLALNTWAHLALVKSGNGETLYVNGVLDATGSKARNTVLGSFNIGGRSGQSWWFPGRIDEVAVYATALSAARVAVHYGAGTGR